MAQSPRSERPKHSDESTNEQTTSVTNALHNTRISEPAQPVRELSQTDHLNKKLLSSLLTMNFPSNTISGDDDMEEDCGDKQ
ncbi:hypothetical protein SARC_15462 [Sphaeroforma arctica JP610]|uniref:Uncharacterized protein n=1 Tax=Sphaeroforma arctica JP610 TaxID=667725 RepID=A0A0L0F5J5_9EUKA|nr:hypothetical protein SARC_15462 [Sphaeroforma arctica JP610]KNC71990.1 hypothetical protein SARC_15462 [Sphaeroforma arctica JP610]|eukprot:XP_014145892.1 hypothetical protein SARC_15462 [Sphaeroforma arctica JP610]